VTLKEIRALAELLREHGLSEIEVEREGVRVRLCRGASPAPARPPADLPATAPRAGTVLAPETTGERRAPVAAIESPMVGTFYRAASPDAPPYVREGDVVKRGQIVCIVEAMKLMNEIEATVGGRIVKVLVDNAQPVEYGQPLFLVEP
jgi:acetyl-CoA carboxylase biotin carboxyl carrier protein